MEKPLPTLLRFDTRFGVLEIALDHEHAPKTAAHFQELAERGILQDAVFYRIVHADAASSVGGIDVIQGGVGWERAGESPTVAHESTAQTGLTHCHGAVSLGRSPESDAGSEFFICIGDQSILDANDDDKNGGFAVFAHVTRGMDVVGTIHNLPADGDPPGGDERFRGQFLTENVSIENVRVIRDAGDER